LQRIALKAAVLTAALLAVPAGAATADPNNNTSTKLRKAVTLEGVRQHQAALQQIADAAGGNRFAGLPGHESSAAYVVDTLRAAGYAPTVQTFTYDAFFEETPTTFAQTAPTAREFVNGNDFRIMSYSGGGTADGAVQAPSGDIRGCYAADWTGFTAGNVALVQRGTPAGFPGGSCTFRIKVQNAIDAGASGVMVYNNTAGVLAGTLGAEGGLSTKPAIGLTQALGEQLRATSGAAVRIVADTDSRPLETKNVIAETEGGDPDRVVMAGAHLDSVTAGPGINDNGSGSAAILEAAVQMAKVKPWNKVRFAWWSAEESGLIGSDHYVDSLSEAQRDQIALYLNFDMVGSPNFARFVYDGDNSAGLEGGSAGAPGSDRIEDVFYGYWQLVGLAAEPTPFNNRSDYGPFNAAGIASGGLFTGAEGIKTAAQAARYGGTAGQPYDHCYHAACDTFGNVSLVGLDQMSDAIAHAIISFAQEGRFEEPIPTAEGPDEGVSGGGGLHDHDHEVGS
jgi:Peptidase family M28/PA domain